jgi:hypoxanthine phosphoribosyltransferase
VLEVDWPFFGELCRALALHVSRRYDPQVVVGVAKAGVIPAAIIATILQREWNSSPS